MKNFIYLFAAFALISCDKPKKLFVGPVKADCVGVGPMKCLMISETKDGDYQFFYDQIEGFEHEEGFLYEIAVKIDKIENPPADASSLKYTLVEVLHKEKVEIPVPDGDWKVSNMLGFKTLNTTPEFTIVAAESKINGYAGCNRMFGKALVKANTIKFENLATTRKMCVENMDVENAFLKLMGSVSSFDLKDEVLELKNKEGIVVITCKK